MTESTIVKYYTGKTVFLTGASGYIGKCILEKLVRACNVKEIIVLLRSKWGKDIKERKEKLLSAILFENIRENNPKLLNKIHIVSGDLHANNLGLNDNDYNYIIDNVNIVFHCAADVRFHLTLIDTIGTNTLGTLRMLEISKTITHLESFIFVSTAFSQTNQHIVKEEFYNSPITPTDMINIYKKTDHYTIKILTEKLLALNGHPNTYAFSKAVTEELVYNYRDFFPISIVRPSIVVCAAQEPIPGWVEGLQGLNGFIVASGRGILHSVMCNGTQQCHMMPVDIVVNTVIAAGWQRSINKQNEIIFYNVAEPPEDAVTWGSYLDYSIALFAKYPFNFCVWYPFGTLKTSIAYHKICQFFLLFLPAVLIDFLCLCFFQKPFMYRIASRIDNGFDLVQHYTTTLYQFSTRNFIQLNELMSDVDKRLFFIDRKSIFYKDLLISYLLGCKRYILKEKSTKIEKARANLKRMFYLHQIFKYCFYILLIYILFTRYQIITEPIKNYWININVPF